MRPIGARRPGVLSQRRYNGEQECSGQDREKSHVGYHTPAADGVGWIVRAGSRSVLMRGRLVESEQLALCQLSAGDAVQGIRHQRERSLAGNPRGDVADGGRSPNASGKPDEGRT